MATGGEDVLDLYFQGQTFWLLHFFLQNASTISDKNIQSYRSSYRQLNSHQIVNCLDFQFQGQPF